ncbi:cation:proton antiporter, partial [Patescibacteria group bacterium]|nr:cation:proton antiporter [Patescibacteria group bacterium]MCG2687796.1 cation:proton antiporter [Candidatus Parcubacteria bacterium]
RNVKSIGKIALLAGFGQVLFTSSLGFLVAYLLGYGFVEGAFLGISFAFSSTIIIIKLLSDKEDLERFYGRITVGILIVQDFIAMLALLGLGAFGNGTGNIGEIIGFSLLKLIVVVLVLFCIAKFILPPLFKSAARSSELLFISAIAWCFFLASGLTFLGFGIETGALLAGIALAGSGFHREIESRIKPLRDFFIILFFIVLGTQLVVSTLISSLSTALILSAFILICNPLIVILVLRIFGYHPRTGFLVGINMAQISEFSFILLSSAVAYGYVQTGTFSMVTIVAMITITISSYLIKYNEAIYEKIEPMFRWLEHVPKQSERKELLSTPGIILFGFHNMGRAILPTIKLLKQDYLIVDFDPSVIDELEERQMPHMYGDMANRDFLDCINAYESKLVVSTIPDMSANGDLIEYMKTKHSRASVVVTVKTAQDAEKMYMLGATFVIVPSMMSGELFAGMLKQKQFKKSSWQASAKKQKDLLKV